MSKIYGEFAIRVKPNNIEPDIDGSTEGYIKHSFTQSIENLKINFDEWCTYTVDISAFETSCIEFSFVIPAGNTIYLLGIGIL